MRYTGRSRRFSTSTLCIFFKKSIFKNQLWMWSLQFIGKRKGVKRAL